MAGNPRRDLSGSRPLAGFNHRGVDSSLGVQTPEGIEFVIFPAGFSIRACAWGIDSLIKGVLIIGLVIAANALDQVLGKWLYLIFNFILSWFYHVGFEVFGNGQTPGKRIMGIRVVRSDGSPVNPGASFLRNLLRFADGFFYLYLIAFLCMAGSKGFRRLGDWAGDTLVVYTARTRLPARFISPALRQQAILWLADIPAVVPLRSLDYEEKQGLLMFARRYPLLGKERADEIAGPWAAKLKQGDEKNSGAVESSAGSSEYLLGIARTLSGIA